MDAVFFSQNHMHAWRDINGVEIVALCDTDADRLQTTAQSFNVNRTYENAAELLSSGGFDFVDIATTVSAHRPLVEMAAKAGVHIVCQKPFAENMVDARAMVKAAEDAGKTLMVHENFRWQSPIQTALSIVKSGTIP